MKTSSKLSALAVFASLSLAVPGLAQELRQGREASPKATRSVQGKKKLERGKKGGLGLKSAPQGVEEGLVVPKKLARPFLKSRRNFERALEMLPELRAQMRKHREDREALRKLARECNEILAGMHEIAGFQYKVLRVHSTAAQNAEALELLKKFSEVASRARAHVGKLEDALGRKEPGGPREPLRALEKDLEVVDALGPRLGLLEPIMIR